MDLAIGFGEERLAMMREREQRTEWEGTYRFSMPDAGRPLQEFAFPPGLAEVIVGGEGASAEIDCFTHRTGEVYQPSLFIRQAVAAHFSLDRLYEEVANNRAANVSWEVRGISLDGVDIPELAGARTMTVWFRQDDSIFVGTQAVTETDRRLSRVRVVLSRQGGRRPKFDFSVEMPPLHFGGQVLLVERSRELSFGILAGAMPLPEGYLLVPIFTRAAERNFVLSHYSLYTATWEYVGEEANMRLLQAVRNAPEGKPEKPQSRNTLRREVADFVKRSCGYQPKITFIRQMTGA